MANVDPASHGGSSGGASSSPEQNYDDDAGVCREPEQFESKSAQSCPLAEPPPKPKREDCQATSLVISKKKRKIEIKRGGPGHSDDPSNSPPPRLEIVSGCFDDTWLQDLIAKQPAEIECVATITGGPCNNGGTSSAGSSSRVCAVRGHKGATYEVDFAVTSRSDPKLKFAASSYAHILPWWAEPRIYEVRFNTCSDSFVGEVAVFPDVEFGVGFEFKYQEETKTTTTPVASVESRKVDLPKKSGKLSKKKRKQRYNGKNWPPREVEFEASYVESTCTPIKVSKNLSFFGFVKIAGMEISPKVCFASWLQKWDKVERVVTELFKVIKRFDDVDEEAKQLKDAESRAAKENTDRKAVDAIASEIGLQSRRSKRTISYPSVQVKGSGLWIELEDLHQCACCMRLSFLFKPLIGLSCSWDMTPAVLKAFAGVTGGGTAALAELKKALDKWLAEREIKAFKIELVLEGSLDGELTFDFDSGVPVNISAPIDINIKGKIEATLAQMNVDRKHFGFRLQGEVDIGLKGETGFRLRADFVPEGVFGSVEWTGIKLTLAFKLKTCVSRTECKPRSDREYPDELSWSIPGAKSDRAELYRFA
jgi:hypothetical protein